ncbi:MAG: phosphatase PAP2 family protein [Candidatus Aminicenantes bacterium]|nr:phosphatase PAP2 family protein [Candidatus Aminicenantes bacterium]
MNAHNVLAAPLILCLLCAPVLRGQEAGEPVEGKSPAAEPVRQDKVAPYVSGFFKDEGEMWTAPFRLDLKNFLVLSTVVAVTGVLVANDEAIYENFKSFQERNPWVDKASPPVTLLGDWGVDCGIAGLFFLGGVIARDRRARDTGLMAWETLLHTGFLVQVVKHLAGRQRPSVDDGRDRWHGPSAFFKRYSEGYFSRYDSFFSGHTVSAWGLATVIAENYRHRSWVPPLCYGLATVAGLSRLTEDAHWFSDVLLGAVVGYAVGRMVVRNQNKRLQVVPALTSGGAGIGVSLLID